ncbi:MAG: MFS transporter [Pseudomonadota bacterium]
MNSAQIQAYYRDNKTARLTTLCVMCVGTFLATFTLSSVLVAIPSIAVTLKADAMQVSWIPSIYMLCNVATTLAIGRLADIWGRKRVYLSGVALLIGASLLGYVAPTIEWLLFSRGLQGIAGAMIFGCSLAILTSVYESGGRSSAIGTMAAAAFTGLTCGPFVGGWLTDDFGWRSVFLFPTPFLVACILTLLWQLKGEWRAEQELRMDWLGASLFAAGACLLFISVSIPISLVTLAGVVLAIIVFREFFKQQARAEFPLIRIRRLWANRMFSRSLLANVMMYGATFPLVFLLSLYLQYIQEMSVTEAGQLIMLQALMTALMSPIAGYWSDRKPTRLVASLGCILVIASLLPMQGLGFGSSITMIAIALGLCGLGFGLFGPPNNSAAIGSVSVERLGVASALLSMSRVVGNMLGTSVIMLLMSIYIGPEQIEPAQYGALVNVVQIALGVCLLFTIIGCYFSLSRE